MNRVVGRILLHETGVGIPDLVVSVYDVDSSSLPQEANPSKQASLIDIWERLQGDRLGSVLTDHGGMFVLEYEDRELKKERPDLFLFVTAPEGPGLDGCSPILHVSCGIRQSAGRIESYLIRLRAEELEKAGVPFPSVQVQVSSSSGAFSARVLALESRKRATEQVLASVRTAWRDAEMPTPKISEIYRKKIKALETDEARRRRPVNSFRFALPVISTRQESEARIAFDSEAERWFMERGDKRSEITFAGVVSADETNLEQRPSAGIGIVLDERSKEFHVAISRTPVRLCTTENGPGELLIQNLKQRFVRARSRRARSPRPDEASDQ